MNNRLTTTLSIILLLCLAMTACSRNKTLIEEEREFAGHVWNRFTPEKYEFDVHDKDEYYNIDLTVTVDTDLFRYSSLPLTVNLYSPTSEHRMFYAEIPLKENGRWKGEAEEGMRKVTSHIRTFFSFNTEGNHKLEIGQATSQYDLEGIRSMDLNIYTVKLDYGNL